MQASILIVFIFFLYGDLHLTHGSPFFPSSNVAMSFQSRKTFLLFSVLSLIATTLLSYFGKHPYLRTLVGTLTAIYKNFFFLYGILVSLLFSIFKSVHFTYKMSGSIVSLYRHLCPFACSLLFTLAIICFSCSTTRLRFSSHMSGSVMIVCWQFWNYLKVYS